MMNEMEKKNKGSQDLCSLDVFGRPTPKTDKSKKKGKMQVKIIFFRKIYSWKGFMQEVFLVQF
jgi:hypothetical protein